jgi:hypothetical protein
VSNEADAVAAVVREYFERLFVARSRADLTAGPLRDYELVSDRFREERQKTGKFPGVIERIDVVAVGEDRARVSLRAWQRPVKFSDRWGKRQQAILYTLGFPDWTGPVELRRLDGEWKIVEFRVDGRPRRPVLRPWPEVERSGIRVRPCVVDPGGRVTWFMVEVENRRDQRIRLKDVRPRWWLSPIAPAAPILLGLWVNPGERLLSPILLPRLPRWRGHLRLDLVAGGGTQEDVVLPLDLDLSRPRNQQIP